MQGPWSRRQDGTRWTQVRRTWLLLLSVAAALVPAADAAAAGRGSRGMVATAHPQATEAGVEILRAGGNAVDAAVAAAFAIGVVEPHASGIGGEGVMLIHLAGSGDTVVVDYKSTAPAGLTPGGPMPGTGFAAVATPGAVAGLARALAEHGTLSLEQVLAPAIRLAAEGFEVRPGLAIAVTDHFTEILEDEALASVFCPEGLPVEAGTRLRNPDLAATLRTIAAEGPGSFYQGALGSAIAAAAAAGGGHLRLDDLKGYRAVVRSPLRRKYRGHLVYSTPGPTGGLAVLENLAVLGRFRLAGRDPLAPETVHLVAEASRRGLADYRAFVGDPAFVTIPASGLLKWGYVRRRAREIRVDRVSAHVEAGSPDGAESASTTSLAAADAAGNMVVITQTLSDQFGARVMVPGTGIILNDEMKNFSRSGPNVYAPGKRPRTSIAPTLVVRRGKPVAAFGTPGSSRIVTTTTLIASRIIDHRLGIQEAIDLPRFCLDRSGERLLVEGRVPVATNAALEKLGYSIEILRELDPYFGGAQGIMVERSGNLLIGAADPRRDGLAAGY